MRLIAAAAAATLLTAAPAFSQPVQGYQLRYMGNVSCGAWPKYLGYDNYQKASLLNWVLGYVSRASIGYSKSLLEVVDQANVAAWMDQYCAANPLNSILDGAQVLEAELYARTTPTR
jgi:hypothetical protein